MKKKFNPALLKEELNRFKLLNEYDFYQEKKELPEYKDLILGDLDEADDDNADDLEPADDSIDNAANDVANDLGVDSDDNGDEETTGDIPEPDAEPAPDTNVDVEPEVATPESDATEVDVTSLVKGSEEAKHSADVASHNTELLLQKLTNLEASTAKMAAMSAKIDSLEQEIVKRNPTPVEKLEMRSLSSYPYSQKLTDYWADKEGPYDVMNTEKKPEEYVLKQSDIDADYSDGEIKKSFSVEDIDSDDYEEEDI
jgi:hypothetical protein